jgi:hypothetical protein
MKSFVTPGKLPPLAKPATSPFTSATKLKLVGRLIQSCRMAGVKPSNLGRNISGCQR